MEIVGDEADFLLGLYFAVVATFNYAIHGFSFGLGLVNIAANGVGGAVVIEVAGILECLKTGHDDVVDRRLCVFVVHRLCAGCQGHDEEEKGENCVFHFD